MPSVRNDFSSSKLKRHFPPGQWKVSLSSKDIEEERAESELSSGLILADKKLLDFLHLHVFLKI